MERAIDLIFAELKKAEAKFPGWPDDPVHGAAILAEETGELVKAALDFYYERHDGTDQMEKEAAQVGAMAIRFLISLNLRWTQEKKEAKPYPGIPAGILDEDLEKHLSEKRYENSQIVETKEEHMSEKKGPLDEKAILKIGGSERAAIVLEAAGKIEKESTLAWIKKKAAAIAPNNIFYEPKSWLICKHLIAFLEALPEKED